MGLEAVRTSQGPIMVVDEFLYSLPSPRSECTRRRRPHACCHSQHRHDQAAAERPADGQPPPSHSSVAPPYRTASEGVLPICHLHFAPLHMNGNSGYRPALCANWPGHWPTRRAAAQQRLQVCSGGMHQPMQVLESPKTACTGEVDEGLMRDTAEASVTHHAARLIPPAGGPSRSAGSVARTSRPPHM